MSEAHTEEAKDPFESDPYPELVVGIIAPLGIDLDQLTVTIQQELERVGYKSTIVRLSALLSEIKGLKARLDDRPEQKRIESHMDAGTELRSRTGIGGILARIAVAAIQREREKETDSVHRPDSKRAYILRSIKHRSEVEDLRQIYGDGFVAISAYAPKTHRERSLTDILAKSAPETDRSKLRSIAADLIERDEREEGIDLGQNVEGAFPLADLFVDASDWSQLKGSVRRFIEALFGNHFVTPVRDEFGMYQAFAAANKSSDLSRQVGAALTSSNGEMIAVGCNDTPRAGGGLYWEGDRPEGRDFELFGYDPSEQSKREILAELLERLRDGDMLSASAVTEDLGATADELLSGGLKGTQVTNLLEFGRVLHAEMTAITDAARRGIPTLGSTLFCTTFPCHLCARLIIASGIDRVVFIEPYPKSKTKDLYYDSVDIDDLHVTKGKVNFHAFVGIAPRRYDHLFRLEGRRKKRGGEAILWNPSTAHPRIRRFQASYISMETSVSAAIANWLRKAELSWED